MRRSLSYSIGLHAAVLIATLVAFPTPRALDPVPTRALPVELVTVAEMTNLKHKAKKTTQTPKPPEPPAQKIEPDKPKPTPQPEEKAEPIPEKTAEKKPEEKKPEPPKPEKPKPVVQKAVEKKKPKTFDPTKIAALLNKIPDAAAKPDESKPTDEKVDAPETDNADEPMTLSEIDAIRVKVQKCWNVGALAGSVDADKMFAKISVSLNEDGSIAGRPTIGELGGGASRLLAERAVQAIQACAPYDFLPADKYNSWRDVEMNFSLSGMM